MARKALYKHATQVNTSSYPDDGSSPVGSNEWNEDPDSQGMLGFTPATATITISSGVATVTDTVTVIAAESGTSDVLDKLAIANTSQYDLIYLFADTGDTITLTNTSSPSADGHIKTVSGSNETLSTTVPTILIRKGNYWYGYGGGVVNAVSDIGDVTISSIGSGELLKWNGSAWINQTLAETGIQATLSNSDIATAVEAASDSNTFTDADHSKLNAIEASATADQTNAEIVAAVEAGSDSNTFTDADHSKLNAIAASANNYVHPNHSGEVTSTADGATVIVDNMVDEANLKVSNAPTNAYVLTARSGNTGGMTWEAASAGGATATHDFTANSTTTYTGTADGSRFGASGAGQRELYIKRIDANNEGVFTKIFKNGSAVEVQIA